MMKNIKIAKLNFVWDCENNKISLNKVAAMRWTKVTLMCILAC